MNFFSLSKRNVDVDFVARGNKCSYEKERKKDRQTDRQTKQEDNNNERNVEEEREGKMARGHERMKRKNLEESH